MGGWYGTEISRRVYVQNGIALIFYVIMIVSQLSQLWDKRRMIYQYSFSFKLTYLCSSGKFCVQLMEGCFSFFPHRWVFDCWLTVGTVTRISWYAHHSLKIIYIRSDEQNIDSWPPTVKCLKNWSYAFFLVNLKSRKLRWVSQRIKTIKTYCWTQVRALILKVTLKFLQILRSLHSGQCVYIKFNLHGIQL